MSQNLSSNSAAASDLVTLPQVEIARDLTFPFRRRQPARITESPQPLAFRARPWVPAVMVGVDLLGLQLALAISFIVREALSPWWPIGLRLHHLAELALTLCIFPLGFALAGMYPGYGLGGVERIRRRVYTMFLLFATLLAWDFVMHSEHPSRGVLLGTLAFAFFLSPLCCALARQLLQHGGCWGTPVLVLGAAKTGRQVVRSLRDSPDLGLVPIALLDDNPDAWGQRVEGVPVVGPLREARRMGKLAKVAIIAMPGLSSPQLTRLTRRLPFPRVMIVPDLTGLATLWVESRDLAGVLGLEVRKNLLQAHNWMIKRVLDYTLTVPLFLLSLPVLAVLGLWIKLVHPDGPVFFTQERVGMGGRPLRVWKLRTMYPDADQRLQRHLQENEEARREWQANFKLDDDPRILPGIGYLLRRTSLDELPQLWNVLRGEMSLVGPRPFPRYHLTGFRPEFRALRQSVIPGLTGLWQVSARSEGLIAQEVHDTYYIRNWSIWLDLYLLARTLGVVLTMKGAR